ncbi:MAG: single-stranded DNA-binding protein [Oscillospiraceae bacterium]|jgi:single-strand DNA-binding protein|nr:single-stranded DNA-binding protein [Oscillospiraceae bacterium]
MLNVIALMGRLTSNPELRHTPNDIAVTSFTLAVERSYVRQGGERETDFIDVIAWRKTAEFVCKYFLKGQLMAVQGFLQTRSYQDRDGNKRKAFEVIADNVHFAESKKSATANTSSVETVGAAVQNSAYTSGNDEDFKEVPIDDDLPF